jgi:phosphatidate cytidylyltransferase
MFGFQELSPLYRLGIFVFGCLTAATVVNLTLLKLNPSNPTFAKVKTIISTWWLMIGAIFLAASFGAVSFTAFFFLLTLFGLREYYKHSRLLEWKRSLFAILVCLTVIQYATIAFTQETLFYALVPIMVGWAIPLFVIFSKDLDNLALIFASLLAPTLIVYYLSHVSAMMVFIPHLPAEEAVIAVLLALFLSEVNDVFQFLTGKAFGRRKIVPQISPNKTEAGFFGGILLTTATSALLMPSWLELTLPQALILGSATAVIGILGDLTFSAMKRYFNVKDFSEALPGHGGILDRLDSLILTAPVFFHLLRIFKGG